MANRSPKSSMPPGRAYSYLRFSTPEQMAGDSLRRQTSLAEEYAAAHGLELDEALTYRDLGVSAFRGGNANVGKLGEFLEAVHVGQVPAGSYLLVESLDRISRDHAFDAQALLSDMIRQEITVVTLIDQRVYSLEGLRQDPMGMMYSILGFMRANEESAVKSRRLKQAWHGKRSVAAEHPLTRIMPAWLSLNPETRRIEEVPERAAVVRRIFGLTLEGVGQHKIAEALNLEGLSTWGEGKKQADRWHRSYIAKILTNPAAIGRMTPHQIEHIDGKKRRVPLEPLEGYYPEVISRETWADVQALLATKGGPRGRQASAPISSILASLAACPRCGKTMTRVQKGKKSLPSLVCTAAKAGDGCEYKSVRYSAVESALALKLPSIIAAREGIEKVEGLEDRADQLQDATSLCQEQIEEVLDMLLEQRSPALQTRLAGLEAQLSTMQEELKRLRDQRDAMAGPVVGSRIGRALEALNGTEGTDMNRAEVNLALRGLFKRAVVNWPEGTVDLEWHVGGTCRVHYAWMGGEWPSRVTADAVSAA